MLTYTNVQTWFEFDLLILKRAEMAGNLGILSRFLNSAILFFSVASKRLKWDPNGVKVVIFLKKLQKLPSDWELCPHTPIHNTLELHQFAQNAT